MTDFTSARFLAGRAAMWRPAPANLAKPSILAEPPGAEALGRFVAEAQGAEAAMVARSTLHALCDIFASQTEPTTVLVDEHCYPITLWAARATAIGGRMLRYRHHDPAHALRLAIECREPYVVVADAWCGGCLRPAPLRALTEAAAGSNGCLIVDDSLAFGVLGEGGWGTPRWMGVPHDRLIWVASAGKAFGTPLTLITGPAREIGRVRRFGPNRTHSSPASTCDIASLAAELADPGLAARRRRVLARARQFRQGLALRGVCTIGAPLPVVGLPLHRHDAERVVAGLGDRGVEAIPVWSRCLRRVVVTFCIRADHTSSDVEAAVHGLGALLVRAA